MATPRITGSVSPIKRPTEVDSDPTRGLVVHESWESAGNGLGGIANMYLNRKCAFNWRISGVRSSLSATISGGQNGLPDVPAINWQLLGNETQKVLTQHPKAILMEHNFPGTIAKIKRALNWLEKFDFATVANIPTANLPDAGASDDFYQILDQLNRGETHYAFGQYALRRTFSVSNFFQGDLPGEDLAEHILDTELLLTSLPLPTLLSQRISSISVQDAAAPGYMWGWRQLPSTIVTGAHNRAEVNTEWWFEQWSTYVYAVA